MNRVAKKPIEIPSNVTVAIDGRKVQVTGPKGLLDLVASSEVELLVADGKVMVKPRSNSRMANQVAGTIRSLVANMVIGVVDGWSKTLEISGVGYRASVTGRDLTLNLGFSHPIVVYAPADISFEVVENKIRVWGLDKIIVGDIASKIRSFKVPDPYKAKGIKYQGELIRRKAGKAAKAAGA